MRKPTIPFFLTNCFLAVLLTACGASPMKEFSACALEKASYSVPYFASPETDYVYRANIAVYGNELSGILIFKKIGAATHRIVFTTEFGNKLMDLEIGEDQFKVNFIVEELNRKILINTLKEDFRLLLKQDFIIDSQFQDPQARIFVSRSGKYADALFESKSDGKLYKIARFSKRKEKFNIHFTPENNIFAGTIVIQHLNIQLKIALNSIQNQ